MKEGIHIFFFLFFFLNVLTKRSCSGALDNVSHKNIRIYAAFKNLFVHIQKWSTTTQTLQGLIRVSYSPWQDFDQESRIMSMLLL